jgi:predicted acetyltransferase
MSGGAGFAGAGAGARPWDVRPTTSLAEWKAAVGSIGHYFGGWPTDDETAERFSRNLPFERLHACWDGDRIVGGAGAFPFRLSVPGGDVPCAGVTVVGVLPTHRRRGILTAMMRAQLEDVRERGEPVAALWASEEVIYRRFGYGMASLSCEIGVPSGYAGLREPPDARTTVRLVPLAESKEAIAPIYERARRGRPGMFARTDAWWETRTLSDPPDRRQGGGEKNCLLLELDGEPAGYALYRVHQKFESGASAGHVDVIEALADGAVATRELWRVLLDMDWKATLKAYLLPIDHPLLHQVGYPRRLQLRAGDGLWVRLVDLPAALAARAYAGDGAVVLDVRDGFLPENEGRWRVEGGQASRTDEEPDLELDVGELGAVYLGGFGFGELARAGTVREVREGAAARADAVFGTGGAKPWCPEIF